MRSVFDVALGGMSILLLLPQASAHGYDGDDVTRPNIIFILVDDMGYSDIGCYGGEVKTPHIDKLAENGIRFTQMYNTSKCFPSRACLLTGVYAQQCGMGQKANSGIRNAITMAELLKTQGYRTLAVGKHHSGVSLYDRGFDHFYGFYYGKEGESCANHFNPGQQRPGEGAPARKPGEHRIYCFDDKEIIPYYTPKEKDWYTTDCFTKWAIEFLDRYKNEDKPYFLYISYTAPHDPLHAWPEDIAKYDGVYDVGYEAIRKARFKRQKELGIVGPDVRLPEATHSAWDKLNSAKKADQIRRMQVYSAMIDRVDQNIGKLLSKVKELGQEDNTLIMFASDNGCSAQNVSAGSGEIGSLTRWASVQKDWANVSNTPLRLYKTFSHEGGICTPLIAYWPKVIRKKGSFNRQPVHFVDVMATVQQITGASYPETFQGKAVAPLQGESLLPAFEGRALPERKNPIFFQYSKGAAIRTDRWKLVTQSMNGKGKVVWELYDMTTDIAETEDLAKKYPDVVSQLSERWQKWYAEATGKE